MAWLMLVVLGLLLVLSVGSGWRGLRAGRRRFRENLRRLADHVLKAGPVEETEGRVKLRFRLGPYPSCLTIEESSSLSGLPSTRLSVGLDLPSPARLQVFEPDPGVVPAQDIRIGHPAFDRAWIVQGKLARKVFARELREESAAHLQALRRFHAPRVEAGPEGVRISVGECVSEEGEVRLLLRTAKALVSALGGEVHPDVLWLEVRADAPALCQICGAGMDGLLVRCRRCRTPHHRDCWTYAGRCSTFGCGEARYLRD